MSSSKIILVTGVNGFVGRHLARELKNDGHRVIGTGMDKSLPGELAEFVETYIGGCDLSDKKAVEGLPLDSVDAIINLAGLAQMGASFSHQDQYMHINVAVHAIIADRLLKLERADVRIVAISSGAVYDSHQPMPLSEDSLLLKQGSPYALSKIKMEQAMDEYRNKGLDIVIVRPFNHIGPGQLGGFLVPDLTKQVLAGGIVMAGDLSTERDYTDVRDVVKAYCLLATKPKLSHYIYNVCSGISVSGRRILEEITGLTRKAGVVIKIDESRLRPNDPKKIVGDNSRLLEDTGWHPTIPLAQTISDVVAES